jgi:hypothetical protein
MNEYHVPFNEAAECSPYLTQCPRCNNPSNACDKLRKELTEAQMEALLDKAGYTYDDAVKDWR